MIKKIVFAGLGIALLASPLISSAATVCPSLSRGMRGAEVTRLQQFLATQYQDFPSPTGYFGPVTEAAVKQWQGEHGIEKLGFVGPKTAAAMGLCKTTADTNVFTPPRTQTAGIDTTKSALEALIQTLLQQIRDLQDQIAQLKGGTQTQTTIACTQEAKLCPDGTAVGRTGPNCEFAACSDTPAAPASCTWNDQTIASGSSVTAYQSSMVDFGMQCVSQTRTCTNGTLSGSYAYSSCTTSGNTVQSCALDGVTIANGAIRKFYSQRTAESASACATAAIDRTCQNGTLSGSTMYQYASCAVQAAESCTPNAPQNQTLSCPTGQTGTIIQTRTSSCPGPTWSGWTTTTNTCTTTPPPPASCTFNGQTVASGSSVTAYQSATATQCVSETRTCTNGTLSGSYTNASCTVTGTTAGLPAGCSFVGSGGIRNAQGGTGGVVNEPLNFLAGGGLSPASCTDLQTVYMAIDWGDGSQTPATGQFTGVVGPTRGYNFTATHAYASPGTYSVYIFGPQKNNSPLTVTVTGPTADAQRNSNLASALAALESALQAIQKFLGL